MDKVAVLGLGIVGSRVRSHLVDAGYEVASWSRTFRSLDGEKETPGEAVEGAKWISSYLKDVPMTREVFGQIKGKISAGSVFLNHATIDLDTTHWLAEQCAEIGCEFLDAPFTGSKDAAGSAALLYYLGGEQKLIDRALPLLKISSKDQIVCGKTGSGTVVKLATNLISATYVQAMSEALVIAKENGVDLEIFTKCAQANASGSPMMAMKYPLMLSGDFTPHFSMSNMLKDSVYALALGDRAGVELPAIRAVSGQMAMMCERGFADVDYAALLKGLERGEGK